jgi:rhodanese-related sulfurtransferase
MKTVVGMVLAGGIAPLAIYWLLLGGATTVTPSEAKQRLRQSGDAAVLVDVRSADAFAAGHIDGAANWPLEAILAVERAEQAPVEYRARTLLLVCDVGLASRRAVGHLAALGFDGAINVRGGIQEWIRSAAGPTGGDFDRWRTGPDRVGPFPFRQSPPWQQAVAVLSFFFIKPIYTLLSLAVVVVLWRSQTPDLAAVRWGMIAFFLGENACAVNYFFFQETSYLAEYLHSFGMLVCFGFLAYAVLDGIDRRILTLSDPQRRCAASGLCRACVKYDDVPCGLKRTFCLIIPALIVLAMMLPAADWQDNSYNTLIFGAPYNYAHLRIYQLFENWYCAGAAVVLLGASLLILAGKGQASIAPAKIAFAAAIGPLGFGMMRMILGGAYNQNRVWYLCWEETTEFLMLLAICCLLWIFRRGLIPSTSRAAALESP